jgi:hypothetical protein
MHTMVEDRLGILHQSQMKRRKKSTGTMSNQTLHLR